MSDHCPQDGGFIGSCGCTHPNHEHSELVKGLLEDAATPRKISVEKADAALSEGFYVTAKDGRTRVGFGRDLKDHIELEAHGEKDIAARKSALLYAMNAVQTTPPVETDHRGIAGRKRYVRMMDDGNAVVVWSDKEGKDADKVFTLRPDRREGRRQGK